MVKFLIVRPRKAKPKDVEPERRGVAATIRRTAGPGIAVPATAPADPERARRRASRVCYRTARISTIPILTPLPYITVHII